MALPVQKIRFKKHRSSIDPSKREAYALFGLILFFVSCGFGGANVGKFGLDIGFSCLTFMMLFLLLDAVRESFASLVARATMILAGIGMVLTLFATGRLILFFIENEGERIHWRYISGGKIYTGEYLAADVILLSLCFLWLLKVARANRLRSLLKQ